MIKGIAESFINCWLSVLKELELKAKEKVDEWVLPINFNFEEFQKENYAIFKNTPNHIKVKIVKTSLTHVYKDGKTENWEPWYKIGEVYEIDERFHRERKDIFYSWNFMTWIEGEIYGIDREDCEIVEENSKGECHNE